MNFFRKKQSRTLEHLANLEKSLGNLYVLFSEQFPEETGFWREVASEEYEHEKWIRTLIASANSGHIKIPKEANTESVVNELISQIEQVGQKAKNGDFTLAEALSFAHELEHLYLEDRIFKTLAEAYNGEEPNIFNELSAASTIHAMRIKVKIDDH